MRSDLKLARNKASVSRFEFTRYLFFYEKIGRRVTGPKRRREFGDVEGEPCALGTETLLLRRDFTERARRLFFREAEYAPRAFA